MSSRDVVVSRDPGSCGRALPGSSSYFYRVSKGLSNSCKAFLDGLIIDIQRMVSNLLLSRRFVIPDPIFPLQACHGLNLLWLHAFDPRKLPSSSGVEENSNQVLGYIRHSAVAEEFGLDLQVGFEIVRETSFHGLNGLKRCNISFAFFLCLALAKEIIIFLVTKFGSLSFFRRVIRSR